MKDMRNACKVLIKNPEAERWLRRLYGYMEDKLKMNLKVTGWECVNWIHLAQYTDQRKAVTKLSEST
jgi:hypothetical protein